MSITTTFEQLPAYVIGVSNADLHADDVKDATINFPNALIMTVGKQLVGKTHYSFCSWHSFDLDIPIGATILAVKFVAYSSGSANGGLFNLTSGFMSPQASGTDDWEDTGGFHNWATRNDNQMAEWDSGTSTDSAVWHNNAPAFSGTAMSVTFVADDPWSFGEGASLSPQNTVTGLVAHLQSYLNNNQGLRGHRVTDSIPVALHMFRPYSSVQNSFQSYYVENYHQSAQLVVEYALDIRDRTILGLGTSTYSIEGAATSVQSLVGDSISTITLEGGQMKTEQDVTHVRGDDLLINVTVSLDQSRTLDGTETWKWNLKRGVESHSMLAKTSAGGTITVDGTTDQPTIVIAATDFPTNTFPASVVDQLYMHELQMTKSSKVETVTRGRFTLQSDIVI